MPGILSRAVLVIFLGLLVAGACFGTVQAAASQPAAEPFTDATVEFTFGKEINFQVILKTDQAINSARIFIQPEGSREDSPFQINPKTIAKNTNQLHYLYNLKDHPLRAFTNIIYHYSVILTNGKIIESPKYTFYYEDNRVEWQTLEEGSFQVHWYAGDLVFALRMLDIAQAGWVKIHTLINLPAPDKMDIYIYADSATMQDTLNFNGKDWIAGHADPDLKAFSVALPAGEEQNLLGEQRIPHEMMHVLLYQKVGAGYANLPTFVIEGLASAAEIYPNPDYQILLDNAYQKRSLLPMVGLCQAFPRDASNALLAYAQSASFVNYLFRVYGTDRLQALVEQYANGLDCEDGIQAVLGETLSELENTWRKDVFGENALSNAFKQLLPWLIILLVILAAPLGLVCVKILRKKQSTK